MTRVLTLGGGADWEAKEGAKHGGRLFPTAFGHNTLKEVVKARHEKQEKRTGTAVIKN